MGTPHDFRTSTIDSITRTMKQRKKISRNKLIDDIVYRYNVSEYTAKRYIDEMCKMRRLKENGGHIIYIFDQPPEKETGEEGQNES